MEANNFSLKLKNLFRQSFRFLFKIKIKSLLKTAGLLFGCLQTIHYFSNEISSDFDQLNYKIEYTSSSYQTLYHACIKDIKNPTQLTEKDQEKISNLLKDLTQNLEDLIKAYKHLGHLLTDIPAKAVHEFACWIDNIVDTQENVCSLQLRNFSKIDKWRDEVQKQVTSDEVQLLKTGNLLSYEVMKHITRNPQTDLYNKMPCKLDEINKKIDQY